MTESVRDLVMDARRARAEERLADARMALEKAVVLCRSSGSSILLAEVLRSLGQIERDQGHHETALPLYAEAVSISRTAGDPLALAHAVRHLGDVYQAIGHLADAEPCYLEALTLYRNEGGVSRLDLANAVRPLALLKERTGRIEEAKRLWAEARALYAAVGVSEGVAECEERLSHLKG